MTRRKLLTLPGLEIRFLGLPARSQSLYRLRYPGFPLNYLRKNNLKNAVFWDVVPCRYFVNRRFGGTYRLHLQGMRNLRAMNQREQVAVVWFIARGFLIPWRCRRYLPPKRRLTKYLHGATSQKTAFFIVTAVKTSNLTRIICFVMRYFGCKAVGYFQFTDRVFRGVAHISRSFSLRHYIPRRQTSYGPKWPHRPLVWYWSTLIWVTAVGVCWLHECAKPSWSLLYLPRENTGPWELYRHPLPRPWWWRAILRDAQLWKCGSNVTNHCHCRQRSSKLWGDQTS
jgi:hypothetical protein